MSNVGYTNPAQEAQKYFANLPEEQKLQYAKLSNTNPLGVDYRTIKGAEKEAAFQQVVSLRNQFFTNRTPDAFQQYMSAIGSLSSHLSPENPQDKNLCDQYMSMALQDLGSVHPNPMQEAQKCFANLPEEQKLQYAKLSNANPLEVDYRTIKGAEKETVKITSVQQYEQLLDKLSGRGTASLDDFVNNHQNKNALNFVKNSHYFTLRGSGERRDDVIKRRERVQGIIKRKSQLKDLTEALQTKNPSKIAASLHSGIDFSQGEGLKTAETTVVLLETYLKEAKNEPELINAEKIYKEAEEKKLSERKSEEVKDCIYAGGTCVFDIKDMLKNSQKISAEEVEKALANALKGEYVPIKNTSSDRDVDFVNSKLLQLRNNEKSHQFLASYSGDLLSDKTEDALIQLYQTANSDYQQKSAERVEFQNTHKEELGFCMSIRALDDYVKTGKADIDKEKNKRKSAGIETDLDKKAKDFEGLTPQQRYEKRVKDYYSKMKYER